MNDDIEPPSPSGQQDSTNDSWLRRIGRSFGSGLKSRDDLNAALDEAQAEEVIDSDARWMIEGVLDVAETQVRDIMIPRGQMSVVERDATLAEVIKEVTESGHSRFPVIGDSRDEIVGLLLAKDLLRRLAKVEGVLGEAAEGPFDVRESLRPVVFVPESKRLNVLLKEFRASRNHMAVVVDEYGGISGLVTIEDVLEQIVGEIDDEHDEAEGAFILRQDDDRFAVRALTPIEEFNRYFDCSFSDEEFDTVGGLVTHEFGRMPTRGEQVQIGEFRFAVQRADSRRVLQLQVTLVDPEPDEAGSND
ncbi:CBS domain-containing protein [bacterium]|nr:CBS domain-containing protein [bacterium]